MGATWGPSTLMGALPLLAGHSGERREGPCRSWLPCPSEAVRSAKVWGWVVTFSLGTLPGPPLLPPQAFPATRTHTPTLLFQSPSICPAFCFLPTSHPVVLPRVAPSVPRTGEVFCPWDRVADSPFSALGPRANRYTTVQPALKRTPGHLALSV